MKGKRKITAAAAAAILAILSAGCKKMSEEGRTIPSVEEMTSISVTEAAETEATDIDTEPVTVTTPETTTLTEPETEPEETDDWTEPVETEFTTYSESLLAETEETVLTLEGNPWSETEMSKVMYVTENCYSRERAVIGATPISQHYEGESVEITALTDTGYFKLAEGGYIHSDYLSEEKPVTTTAATTTAATEPEELIDDGNDSGTAAPVVTDTSKPVETLPFIDPGLGGGGSGGGSAVSTGSYSVLSSSRYAYKQLSAAEQKLYNNVVDAVKNFSSIVEIPEGMTKDDVVKVYTVVYNSEPQLFWMGSTISAGGSFATISYKTTDMDEIKAMQKEIDSAASAILSKAANYTGTVSKLKVFYDSIVYQSEFSLSEGGYNSTVYNGLTGKGQLQCAGYAKTMQYLCDMSGIDCCVVVGTNSEGSSHAWNVVYCQNGYYNLDATWGDPVSSYAKSDYLQYEFFLVPDAWIHNITHYNVNNMTRSNGNTIHLFDPPACTKEGCNYFAAYNKLYNTKEEAEKAFYAELDAQIAAGKTVAEIRVASKSIYDSMMNDDAFRTYQKYAKGKSGNVQKLVKKGSYTQGVLVVHYDIVYN